MPKNKIVPLMGDNEEISQSGAESAINEAKIASKPLKNRKHEAFARELAKQPSQSQDSAYLKVYPSADPNSAIAAASRLLSNVNVRQRVMELMSRERPILERVSERMNDHVDSSTESISLEACKTVMRIAGAMNEEKQADSSYNPTQINIIIRPQTPDVKEVTLE
jgi:hypothetical protein